MRDGWNTRRLFLTTLLLGLAAGLWGTVLYRLGAGLADAPVEAPEAPPARAQARAGGASVVPGFDPDVRDPFVPAPPKRAAGPNGAPTDDPGPALPPALTLQGIVGRSALLRTPDGSLRPATPGDTVAGWRVVRVTPEGVDLRREGRTHPLTMPQD